MLESYGGIVLVAQIYSSDQAMIGFVATALWLYVSRKHRLIDRELDKKMIQAITIRNVVPPLVFIGSIGVVYINPYIASAFWVIIFPIIKIVDRKHKDID